MGRRRTASKSLPAHLYCRDGYYAYRHPIDGREYGLGRNRLRAVIQANAANRTIARNTVAARIAEGLLTLLTEQEIVRAAEERESMCGIYFLVHAGRVVYVGQSKHVYHRIATHTREGTKEFDSFHVIPCSECILSELEATYIAALQPKYNIEQHSRVARAAIEAFRAPIQPIQPREKFEPDVETK